MNTTNSSQKIVLGEAKDTNKNIILPNQRISRKKKLAKKWIEDSIDFFINNSKNETSKRKSIEEINRNWDYYNSKLSADSLKKHIDPFGVEDDLFKDGEIPYEFFNIIHTPFDTIIGEELKRTTEVKGYALNSNIINRKTKEFKEKVKTYFNKLVQAEGKVNEKELQEKLKEFDVHYKKDLQSAHEIMVNQLLTILSESSIVNARYKFNTGFKTYEVVGEQINRVYHIGKEVTFSNVDGRKFWVMGMGDSNWIQDGVAWLEKDYLSPNKIIEEFAEDLTDSEIDEIMKLASGETPFIVPDRIFLIGNDSNPNAVALPLADRDGFIVTDGNGEYFESDTINGTIAIYRVQWLSLRCIGKLKYYDEFGDAQYDWVDEEYEIDESKGEEVEWIWVNELYEGCRIGNKMYKKCRPCPVQMRSSLNPSIVRPSYVGYINSDGNSKCTSRLDRLVSYQIMYNIFANKLITLWTQNLGKVAVIDVSEIPSDMNTDEWYIWLRRFKLMFKNSFEEGKKGAAKGQLIGNMQQGSKTIDLSLAEEVNQCVVMLSWIEERVNKIAAIPEARQGNVDGSAGLGVTQQGIINSASQTEVDFFIHEMIKSKTYELLVEYTKVLWKDTKEMRQYVLDDLSNFILDFDGELLNEADYGVKITSSYKLYEMFTTIKQLLHAAMQNGTITLADAAKLLLSNSPSEMISNLEIAEDKRMEQSQASSQIDQQIEQQKLQVEMQLEQLKHENKLAQLEKEFIYKLQEKKLDFEFLKTQHSFDTNQNGVEDAVEIEIEKIKEEAMNSIKMKEIEANKEMQNKELENKITIEKIKSKNKQSSLK